jgi:mono/diheme cytochrome c family protein
LLGLGASLVAAACGGPAVPRPTAADATRGQERFADLTLADLQHGRTLYVGRCGGCHALKPPSELPAEQWQAEVAEMRQKNGVELSDAEAEAIVRYLVVAATAG